MCLQTLEKSDQDPNVHRRPPPPLHSSKPLLLLHYSAVRSNRRYCVMLDYKFRVLEVVPSPLISRKVTIFGSSNGLLCARIHGESQILPSLLLWNPATREAKQVPHPCIEKLSGDFDGGFGFSPIVNDYKIVMSYFDYKVRRKQRLLVEMNPKLYRGWSLSTRHF
ncbi:uncharacterized protein LOC129286804 isoform X2 [Prosopis cineraria]|uniref:uncharacterized protein LOC129286804 isoform X2 n=1 Tax=Prosopis cineraria TaxID=364024 RepID=UPI002410367C|nr:uncharacterized protein LOC129286804 isoform X2 [Prosopis cineraria]